MTRDPVPRLRMFAGPNGSGKTTVKKSLNRSAKWFGIYINPDDLEAIVRKTGVLSVADLGLEVSPDEIRSYFAASSFLQSQNLHTSAASITEADGVINFGGVAFNSYHASVLSDLLRRKAMEGGVSFSFETVMSARDKVEILAEAQALGFRTYLYFIATRNPKINIERVRGRVASGGHDVPTNKIVERYYRSLALLGDAIRASNRAFLFDTSEEEQWYFAEVTDGTRIDLKSDEIPDWFAPVLSRFDAESAG